MSEKVAIGQTVRNITIFSQRDNEMVTVQSDDVTWGSLKDNFEEEISFNNMRGVVKSTRNTLDVDDARLPEGEFTLFLFPKKVSSGMAVYNENEYMKDFNSKELRKMCSERSLGTSGRKEDFAKRLANYDQKNAGTPEVKEIKKEVVSEILPATSTITQSIGVIEKATVATEMNVRITEVNQLDQLLTTLFPGMEVVEIEAIINLKASLKWGGIIQQIPIKKSVEEVLTLRKKAETEKSESKAPTKEDLIAEARKFSTEMCF
jgi:ethanolamine ammonia-lyase large subunit